MRRVVVSIVRVAAVLVRRVDVVDALDRQRISSSRNTPPRTRPSPSARSSRRRCCSGSSARRRRRRCSERFAWWFRTTANRRRRPLAIPARFLHAVLVLRRVDVVQIASLNPDASRLLGHLRPHLQVPSRSQTDIAVVLHGTHAVDHHRQADVAATASISSAARRHASSAVSCSSRISR